MNTIDNRQMQNSALTYVTNKVHILSTHSKKISSQLIMSSSRNRKIRHIHNLHHQTRPSRKVLGALTLACLGIVLLPGKTCVFPFPEDILN